MENSDLRGVATSEKNAYVDYGILPSQIGVKLENYTYKMTSNVLDRNNGKCERTSKTLGNGYVIEGEVILPPVMAYLCTKDGRSIDTLGS